MWKKIAIVGGYGRMGRFFSRLFKEDGFDVTICGRRIDEAKRAAKRLKVSFGSIDESVQKADLVIVSVPVEHTYEVCMSIADKMKKDSVLVEIASVKTGIADRLSRELPRRVRFASIHPLFGPTVRDLHDRNIVMIRDGDSDASRTLSSYLESKGATVTYLTVDEHDKAMATIQALHHYALLSFSHAFRSEIRKDPKLANLLTESLKLTLRSVRRILANLDAVLEIQKNNPYAKEARRKFSRIFQKSE